MDIWGQHFEALFCNNREEMFQGQKTASKEAITFKV
jgi:hypothetical protein